MAFQVKSWGNDSGFRGSLQQAELDRPRGGFASALIVYYLRGTLIPWGPICSLAELASINS